VIEQFGRQFVAQALERVGDGTVVVGNVSGN